MIPCASAVRATASVHRARDSMSPVLYAPNSPMNSGTPFAAAHSAVPANSSSMAARSSSLPDHAVPSHASEPGTHSAPWWVKVKGA